jgi:transposase
MGNLWIIEGVCQDLKLSSVANSYLDNRTIHHKVTVGDAIVALILNGLGFVTRSLYMTSSFFEGKPVELLLGENIRAGDLYDDTLGRALDENWGSI